MDLRVYFQKLKQLETTIEEVFPIIVSHETPDGGKPGVFTQVNKSSAAKLVLEGKARLATLEEAEQFSSQMIKEKEEAHRAALAGRVQLNLVSEQDLRAIKTVLKGTKKE